MGSKGLYQQMHSLIVRSVNSISTLNIYNKLFIMISIIQSILETVRTVKLCSRFIYTFATLSTPVKKEGGGYHSFVLFTSFYLYLLDSQVFFSVFLAVCV